MLLNRAAGTRCIPAISINENQSLIAINIINNNSLIIIDWLNQSIKIDTHSPNGLTSRHKSRAYCVSTITRLHSFPCFDQSHGIVTKHLFPSAVECLVYATLKAHYIFLLIIILLSSLSVAQVNVPGVCFFAILRRHTNYLF